MQSHDLEAPQVAKGLLAGPTAEAGTHRTLPPVPATHEAARALGSGASLTAVARTLSAQPGRIMPALQRMLGNRVLQRVVALAREGDGAFAVEPDVEERIQRSRGGGQVLDSTVRTQMEGAFRPAGEPSPDFSGVRVHSDGEADSLNRSVNARAFTTGQDIYFRQGAYSPGTSSGRELIAHELTHVVQQNGAQPQAKLTVSHPGDRFEQEADRVAHDIAHQEIAPAAADGAAPAQAVQREEEKKEEDVQTKADPGSLQRQEDEKKDEES